MQGDGKAVGETLSSGQLDLNKAFEEWVQAGSEALSVNEAETADEAAVLPASMPLCIPFPVF